MQILCYLFIDVLQALDERISHTNNVCELQKPEPRFRLTTLFLSVGIIYSTILSASPLDLLKNKKWALYLIKAFIFIYYFEYYYEFKNIGNWLFDI